MKPPNCDNRPLYHHRVLHLGACAACIFATIVVRALLPPVPPSVAVAALPLAAGANQASPQPTSSPTPSPQYAAATARGTAKPAVDEVLAQAVVIPAQWTATNMPTSTATRTPTIAAGTPRPTPRELHTNFGFGHRSSFGVDVQVVVTGDMDLDGDLDLVTADAAGRVAVSINDGAGAVPTSQSVGPATTGVAALAIGDMDGDGDLDIVTASRTAPGTVFVNQATQVGIAGPFVATVTFGAVPTSDLPPLLALADVDGDARLDVALANGSAGHAIYPNLATGALGAPRPFDVSAEAAQALAVGDGDGDGDVDIAIARRRADGQSLVHGYANRGDGTFIEAPSGAAPVPMIHALRMGDLNGDGILEAAALVQGWHYGRARTGVFLRVYRGLFAGGHAFDDVSDPYDTGTSLDLGDVDGDGDLDALIGQSAGPVVLWVNNRNRLASVAEYWYGPSGFTTRSALFADLDGNSGLDLVAPYDGHPGAIYLSDGGYGTVPASPERIGYSYTPGEGLVTGDMNGDGSLDLVTGTGRLYLTPDVANGGFRSAGQFFYPQGFTDLTSMQVGDVDADNDLDVIGLRRSHGGTVGGGAVFINGGAGTASVARTFGDGLAPGQSLAVGDLDADGDLDLVWAGERPIAGQTHQDYILKNDGLGNFAASESFGTASGFAHSAALGDMDGDGDLDVVIGRSGQSGGGLPDAVYFNDGTGSLGDGQSLGPTSDFTQQVFAGDMDRDGDLDVVSLNQREEHVIHLNDGHGGFGEEVLFGSGDDMVFGGTMADFDGDGDWDVAVARHLLDPDPVTLYINDGRAHLSAVLLVAPWFLADQPAPVLVAGDFDRDGDADLVAADYLRDLRIFRNGQAHGRLLANDPATVAIGRPRPLADGAGFSVARVLDSQVIEVPFHLDDREGDAADVRAWYSPDGGGAWIPAQPAAGYAQDDLASNRDHVFRWDVLGDAAAGNGFFGFTDNMVFRIEARPDVVPVAHAVAGPYQRPFRAAQTFPFRVRGAQVRVTNVTGRAVAGAVVYRLPAGRSSGGLPLVGDRDRPLRTNPQGYLLGRSRIAYGDRLFAMAPVSRAANVAGFGPNLALYHTSARPSPEGLAMPALSSGMVQTLKVSGEYPLALFDLTISLEWDARRDRQFLNQLQFDLERASAALYDWTDGQVALGTTRVHQDREEWGNADIRLYATNRLRPSASQGGVTTEREGVQDPDRPTVVYGPGSVRIGSVWNRYGEAGGSLGEDWPRTLAHELAHYLLFLDDNYLGLDRQGRLVAVAGCPGAMSNPYRTDWSELHPGRLPAGSDPGEVWTWAAHCAATLSNVSTGRADWDTVQRFLPELVGPAARGPNSGPSDAPFDLTRVTFIEPRDRAGGATEPRALDVPVFDVYLPGGYAASTTARAFLFQRNRVVNSQYSAAGPRPSAWYEGDRVTDLGQPVRDQLTAFGATVGDRVCVFDAATAAGLAGCEPIRVGDSQLDLKVIPNWRPDVIVLPLAAREITVAVRGVPGGLDLAARLYPAEDPAPECVSLSPDGIGYAARFPLLEWPAMEGYVHVWVEQDGDSLRCSEPTGDVNSGGEAVTDFSLGGNPGRAGDRPGYDRLRPGYRKFRPAPAASLDGMVMVFGDVQFDAGELYSLQPVTILPSVPSWFTVVGHAYRLAASVSAPSLANRDSTAPRTSISFSYFEADVPAGEEQYLHIYWYDAAAGTWLPLDTALDTDHNAASAATHGDGLYALMSSIEVLLASTGWNLFSYPVQVPRPVDEALASIAGQFNIVYGYAPDDRADPWKVWAPNVPHWVNDLPELRYGNGYWIHITSSGSIVARLRGTQARPDPQRGLARYDLAADPVPVPPATYYGEVYSGTGFVAQAGQVVTAIVGGRTCGVARTEIQVGKVVYHVDVQADDGAGTAGCGALGRMVTFRVQDRDMAPHPTWANDRVSAVALRPASDATDGVIEGVARLQGRTNHAGTQVEADGALAITDAAGRYRLELGPGVHDVVVHRDRYLPARQRAVVVLARQTATVSDGELRGGDTDDNGAVDLYDLVRVGASYDTTPPDNPLADVNEDGTVNLFDLVLVGSNYGVRGEQPLGATGLAVPKPAPRDTSMVKELSVRCGGAPIAGLEPVGAQRLPLAGESPGSPHALWLSAPQRVTAGQPVEALVCVAPLADVAGVDVRITYDATLLAIVDADPTAAGLQAASGTWAEGTVMAWNEASVEHSRGLVHVAAARTSAGSVTVSGGAGAVLRLTFQARGTGRSGLALQTIGLADGQARALDVRGGSLPAQLYLPWGWRR